MDLVGLNEHAEAKGISRKRLAHLLDVAEKSMREKGTPVKLVHQAGRGCKIYVDRDAVRATETISRLDKLEVVVQDMRDDLDVVMARVA